MNILLSIDDSAHSRAAINVALARLWPSGSNIKVISIVEINDDKVQPTKNESSDLFHHMFSESAKLMVKQVAEKMQNTFKETCVTHEVLFGYTKEMILDCATNWPADLVILGSHGRRGLSRILLGSVSQTFLLYGQCSTLIVRLPNDAGKKDNNFENILIAIDPTSHSESALDYALAMPWSEKAHFKLLAVLPPSNSNPPDGLNTFKEFLDYGTRKFANKFSKERVTSIMVQGDPGENILNTAANWPASLIIMGSRGHGKMARLWLGSVSQEVVLQAECPVEVVKHSKFIYENRHLHTSNNELAVQTNNNMHI